MLIFFCIIVISYYFIYCLVAPGFCIFYSLSFQVLQKTLLVLLFWKTIAKIRKQNCLKSYFDGTCLCNILLRNDKNGCMWTLLWTNQAVFWGGPTSSESQAVAWFTCCPCICLWCVVTLKAFEILGCFGSAGQKKGQTVRIWVGYPLWNKLPNFCLAWTSFCSKRSLAAP